MVFSNTCFNKELSLAVFVERENVLALVIRIGMSLFLCSDKSETSFFSPCYTLDSKIYNNNSSILIDMVYAFNRLSGLLINAFII